MGDITNIGWTDHTQNFWVGCAKKSRGCRFCYAETLNRRWTPKGETSTLWRRKGARRITSEANWRKPFAWNRAAEKAGEPTLAFASSLSDMFEDHPDLPEPRARALAMPIATPWVIWQYLSKRPENIARMVPWQDDWPVNVWIGASVEDQRAADERLPILTALTGAKVRFISVEPMVGPVDLGEHVAGLDWVIIGGESGALSRVDRMDPQWALSLIEQCRHAGVPVFFKQTGSILAHELGLSGKGEDINELPAEFRTRAFPPLVVAA
jgi:protein gp37